MKAKLEEKKVSLKKSLEMLIAQHAEIQKQITMHEGALQYNDILIDELDKADKETVASVKSAEEIPAQ